MKKAIPKIQEWEENGKIYSQNREQEGNEKKHSHISGRGIRGYHIWEYPGTPGTGREWTKKNIII